MIKKNIFLVVVACNVIVTAYAMNSELPSTITMPSAKKLSYNLCEEGFGHFVSAKNIDELLGGKKLSPLKLHNIVDAYVDDYNREIYDEAKRQRQHIGIQLPIPARLQKEQILKCLLHESPELYNKLLAYVEELKADSKELKQSKL